MKFFLLLPLTTLLSVGALSQDHPTPSQKTVQVPSRSEMQSQMQEAVNDLNKQIGDLEKRIAEAKATNAGGETIKEMEEELAMLKKQAQMIGGLNRNLSRMSDKVLKQAAEEDGTTVPKRDVTRISIIPKKIASDAELAVFIKRVHAGVERLIPAAERAEALNIYNETKTKYKSTAIVANAATGCWILGHWEKALYIMGRTCQDDITDADNLNNYAAFLIMTGGEQAALPILDYLNEQYPNNSTILNNIGQAWFGLGDLDKAKKFLTATTELYPNHSMANSTLGDIAVANSDPATAISQIKASLKETYDPEKEARLKKLGYEIKFADMPPLNYPMKNDPLGLIPLINSWDPDKIQSSIADGQTALTLQRYENGIENFKKDLGGENRELDKKIEDRLKRLSSDQTYNQEFIEPYDCPAHLLANRSLQLYCLEKSGLCIRRPEFSPPFLTGLWMPLQRPRPDLDQLLSVTQIIEDCDKLWFQEVLQPLEVLGRQMPSSASENCEEYDAKIDAYLSKRKQIYSRGVKLIQNEFIKNSDRLTTYIKYKLYSTLDDPPKDMNDLSTALISDIEARIERRRDRNHDYDLVLSLIEMAKKFEDRYKSSCGNDAAPDAQQGEDIIAPLKITTVECQYIKHVITPVRYEFKLQCNTITEKTDPKLKKRKPDIPKGSAHNASRGNSSRGPVQGPRGPNILFDDMADIEVATMKGPLTSEYKDISQFSLEYNKWGNLVGFNFQLSEDGSTLKDPDSVESGVDSRWSWNAIASPKKGYMYRLLSEELPKESLR